MSDGSCRFSVKQVISDTTKMQLLENANTIPTLGNIFQSYFTNPTTINLSGWYTLLSLNSGNTISQIRFPMTSSRASRTAIRCQSALKETGEINEPWRELAYADEVPILNSDGTISVTSRQTQELLTTYLGDMRGSTVGEIKEAINKVFNLSKGGIMVISLLMDVKGFLTHISENSYTTFKDDTKYTIILSGNHKYQKGYALGEIKELGSMRSFYFRINNGYYEYLGESVTMDAVQKAIEEAFKKRNL